MVRYRIVDRKTEADCGDGQQLFIRDVYQNDEEVENRVIQHLAQLQSDAFGLHNNLKAIDIDVIKLEKSFNA